MNPHTFTRLLWQLPVLTWLIILLLPGVPWHSELFGPWPLWLLASPALLMDIGKCLFSRWQIRGPASSSRSKNARPDFSQAMHRRLWYFPLSRPCPGIP